MRLLFERTLLLLASMIVSEEIVELFRSSQFEVSSKSVTPLLRNVGSRLETDRKFASGKSVEETTLPVGEPPA